LVLEPITSQKIFEYLRIQWMNNAHVRLFALAKRPPGTPNGQWIANAAEGKQKDLLRLLTVESPRGIGTKIERSLDTLGSQTFTMTFITIGEK
jgi:hypothetical protein